MGPGLGKSVWLVKEDELCRNAAIAEPTSQKTPASAGSADACRMLSRQMRQLPRAMHHRRHPGRQKAAHSRQPGHLPAILPCRAAHLPGLQMYKRRKRHRLLRLLKTKTSGEEGYRPGLPCMARPWQGM